MRPANVSAASVRSLYRSYLRQIQVLPHSYIRLFFRVRARDEIERVQEFGAPTLRARNLETVTKSIKKLARANSGDKDAFGHVLDLAYGRKGKLKWELLEPMLHPQGSPNEPLIQGKESSRPPVVSQGLEALFTNAHSRKTKALNKAEILLPRTLPARADPKSEDAKLLGPLSKRREVNIRRRFFNNETKKLQPPLSLPAGRKASSRIPPDGGVTPILQTDLANIVGTLNHGPTRTRREHEPSSPEEASEVCQQERHPSRWVRRRFRALMSKIPEFHVSEGKGSPIVKGSSLGFAPHSKTPDHMPKADPATLAWLYKLDVSKNRAEQESKKPNGR